MMKKHIRFATVLSIAVMSTMGIAMTSFAEQGWTEESGAWVYYDKDGSKVTDGWRKSGNDWYWLDSDGVMAVDTVVEYQNDYYYVDDNGVMVKNQWVQVDNLDGFDEDAPANLWYYFRNTGKAYKAGEDGKTVLRTINGKKYAFDMEGKMLFGWVDDNSTRQTGDDAWKSCDYYMGGEDDGAAAVGWLELFVIDTDLNWTKEEESEYQNYWFYFKNDGRKVKQLVDAEEPVRTRTINGKVYSFDVNGRMTFGWSAVIATVNTASASTSSYGYGYFSARDDGARVSRGWFQVVPDSRIDKNGYDEEEAGWYYAIGSGRLYTSGFKTINGKKYAFDNSGRMLTGLQAVSIDKSGEETVLWNLKLDEEDKLLAATALINGNLYVMNTIDYEGNEVQDLDNHNTMTLNYVADYESMGKDVDYGIYYFGDDGAVKTSRRTVTVDGEKYEFYFTESGSKKGKGINGIKGNFIYQNGKKLKADKELKYEAYYIARETSLNAVGGDTGNIVKDYIYYVSPEDFADFETADSRDGLFLVNSSGSIIKGNREVRDGNDMYYEVKDGRVVSYYGKDGKDKRDVINIR